MVKQPMLWLARSILIGASYIIGLMLVGTFLAAFGVHFASASQGAEMMPWFVLRPSS